MGKWGTSTNEFWRQKTRVPGLSRGVVCMILRLAVLIQYRRVTHGQTHGHTMMAITRTSLWRCAGKTSTTVNKIQLAPVHNILKYLQLSNCWMNSPTLWQHVHCCTDFYLNAIQQHSHSQWHKKIQILGNKTKTKTKGLHGKPVLMATGIANWKWQTLTPTKSNTPETITKTFLQVIRSATPTSMPNLVQIRPWKAYVQIDKT